jgi:D-alanyl-D-alanine carboxypeptidase/D-alanyl-D-alanine-endopeptidase (penicillin-binding protein 4)
MTMPLPIPRRRPAVPIPRILLLAALAAWIAAGAGAPFAAAASPVGGADAVLVVAPDGRVLWSHRPRAAMIPASTLKIVTALAALHYLGESHRFETHFFREGPDLRVKGLGDPLLVSEVVREAAAEAAAEVDSVRHLLLDDSYFAGELTVPGVSDSTNPYDAPNGALCVNFNTVFFRTAGGRPVSAEPQTPLLPMVLPRIRASGLDSGRIVLSAENDEALRYAGALFAHFLEARGLALTGEIRRAPATPSDAVPLVRHRSPYALTEVISRLLEFSNNFIANQLAIACGIQAHGAPGTLEKGVSALNRYAREVLGLEGAVVAEGSGISRENRLSAAHLVAALERFSPHHRLMARSGNEWYKTGHLSGIRTRAGYVEAPGGRLYRFAVLVNTRGKTTGPAMGRVHRLVERDAAGPAGSP